MASVIQAPYGPVFQAILIQAPGASIEFYISAEIGTKYRVDV